MKVEIKKVKLSQIRPNPENPRQIGKKQFDRLVKSLQEFPEMMELREVVVDENMMILGGNMRYKALKQAGVKECIAKIVIGLTPEKKREFIIKDNGAYGEWDMELLSAWDDFPLIEWGVELPEDWMRKGEDGAVDMDEVDFFEDKKKTGKFTYSEADETAIADDLRTMEEKYVGFRFYL